MDHDGPRYEGGRVHVHPSMRAICAHLVEHGTLTASRPLDSYLRVRAEEL
jgi:hypothetical protein